MSSEGEGQIEDPNALPLYKEVTERKQTLPGSLLVSAFPVQTGHGKVALETYRLGLFERFCLFRKRRSDSSTGFQLVVSPSPNFGRISVMASLWIGGKWARTVSEATRVHFSDPYFFHMAKYQRNSTGTVHDLLHLENEDGFLALGSYLRKTLKYVPRLSAVVCVSHATANALRALYPETSPVVIHNWTGPEYRPRDSSVARKRLKLPESKKLLLSVGLDLPRKNLKILPKVLRQLPDDYIIVRVGRSKLLEDEIPHDRLLTFGNLSPDLFPFIYNACNALLMPSRSEGFGVPIIEGVNSGLPVVASDIPVFREILGNGHPWFAAPDDVTGWRQCILDASEVSPGMQTLRSVYNELVGRYTSARALRDYQNLLGACSSTR